MTELPTAGNVSAMNIPHANLVFDLHDEVEVTVERSDGGGMARETIRHANRVSFICLKAYAFDDRAEPKDAHDIAYCLEHGEGGVDAAVAELRVAVEGRHREAIVAALRRLGARFGDDEGLEGYRKDGPVSVAKFEIGAGSDRAEQRALRQRQVAAVLQRLLDALADLWRTEPEKEQ